MDGVGRARASLLRRSFSFSPFTLFFNMALYNILFLQQNIPTFPHELYFAPITIFIELVILKCQGMNKSPFDTHPKTMTAAVLSFLLFSYCLSRYSTVSDSMNRAASLLWSFCLVSLVSLLLPDFFRPILFVLCFLLHVFELVHSFGTRIWRVFEEWMNVQRIHIIGFFINPIFTNRMQIPPRLPV